MDSLAQELLEIIIDYVPPYQARSCSLVARRWRKRSQQLHSGSVVFTGEREVGRWFRNIPQDPDGILSYVQEVEFRCILHWLDATLLGRTLKCFRHARTLKFYETGLPPSEVQKIVISGDFGKEITSLDFVSTFSTTPTLVQLIFSLPKLTDVVICSPKCDEPAIPAVPNVTWQREPLLSLDLLHPRGGATEFLALCGITSYRVGVSVGDPMMEKIVARSSEIMSELQLKGMRLHENFVPETDADGSHSSFMTPASAFSSVVHLPPLPALTTVEVRLPSSNPSTRLSTLLSRIRPAPALSSVILIHTSRENILDSRRWTDVDKWLAWVATDVRSKRTLTAVLALWPEGNPKWEECLPEFRKAGGELKVEIGLRKW